MHEVLPPEVNSAAPVEFVAAVAHTPVRRDADVNDIVFVGRPNSTRVYGTSAVVATLAPKYSTKLDTDERLVGLVGDGFRSARNKSTPLGPRIVPRYHPPGTDSTVYRNWSPGLMERPSGTRQLTPASPSKPAWQFRLAAPSARGRTSTPLPPMLNTAVGPTTPLTEFPSVCTPMYPPAQFRARYVARPIALTVTDWASVVVLPGQCAYVDAHVYTDASHHVSTATGIGLVPETGAGAVPTTCCGTVGLGKDVVETRLAVVDVDLARMVVGEVADVVGGGEIVVACTVVAGLWARAPGSRGAAASATGVTGPGAEPPQAAAAKARPKAATTIPRVRLIMYRLPPAPGANPTVTPHDRHVASST